MVKKADPKTDPKTTIVQDGDPVLRAVAKPVPLADIGTKKLNEILANMTVALNREHDGVAIAAPQIGIPLRIFIVSSRAFTVDEDKKTKGKIKKEKEVALTLPARDMIVINPEITKLSRKKVKVPEGCLSCRWLYGDTIRNEKVTIRAYDEHGKPFTYGGSALIAQIFQHETDHLNGILFVDHATNIEEMTPEQIAEVEKNSKRST